MRPSAMVVAAILFVAAMLLFSGAYNTLLRFFAAPTGHGLLVLFVDTVGLMITLTGLGLIMYATDRRLGHIRTRRPFFERLLGYPPDAPLPVRPEPEALSAPDRRPSRARDRK